jgi:hypothetical protein
MRGYSGPHWNGRRCGTCRFPGPPNGELHKTPSWAFADVEDDVDGSDHIYGAVGIDSISGGMCRAPLRWVKLPSPRRKLKSAAARLRGAASHSRGIAAVRAGHARRSAPSTIAKLTRNRRVVRTRFELGNTAALRARHMTAGSWDKRTHPAGSPPSSACDTAGAG